MLIDGVTIINSPMWEIHPVLCTNVTVRGVTIHSHGPNNDGCDPESSVDVLIDGCTFDTGDDCIAIKSGRNGDGRRLHAPSENRALASREEPGWSYSTVSVWGSIRCMWLRSATSGIVSPGLPATAGLTRPHTSVPSTRK